MSSSGVLTSMSVNVRALVPGSSNSKPSLRMHADAIRKKPAVGGRSRSKVRFELIVNLGRLGSVAISFNGGGTIDRHGDWHGVAYSTWVEDGRHENSAKRYIDIQRQRE